MNNVVIETRDRLGLSENLAPSLDLGLAQRTPRSPHDAAMRVAIICDLLEERWPSMDLVAEMLFINLKRIASGEIAATALRPKFDARFALLPGIGQLGLARKTDRMLNRFWYYPKVIAHSSSNFDVFHIIDHSYAHLAHWLPSNSIVVTCHDVDPFRCLFKPAAENRSAIFRKMSRHMLSGLRRATRVICVSEATKADLLEHRLVAAERLVVIHNGVDPIFSAEPNAQAESELAALLGPKLGDAGPELLHVGSTIERKRVDVLISVFAALLEKFPAARLIQVGGALTNSQAELARRLGVGERIKVLPPIERSILSAVYRRAALVLLPSDREGFGLPVVESLACGTPVVASELPPFKEVGGKAVVYCPPGNVQQWTRQVAALLLEHRNQPEHWAARQLSGQQRAAVFSWSENARKTAEVYASLRQASSPPRAI